MKNVECATARPSQEPAVMSANSSSFTVFSSLFIALASLFCFFSCSTSDSSKRTADHLNALSYAYHYRSLDTVKYYCDKQVRDRKELSEYADGIAERYNNEAFYWIAKMTYDRAESCLNLIPDITDNQIELLVCYVQQMRLCQRRSRNREFYDCRERALAALQRIDEERQLLDERQRQRLLYAETELAIVSSTYYYYVGLERQSIEALEAINADEVERDTAQFLNYLYNIGAGGILTKGTAEEIFQQEMDCLLRCYQIAQRDGYPYFTANALEAIAEHLITNAPTPEMWDRSLSLVNPYGLSEDKLAIWLAEEALYIFQEFGDVYQIAGAYRTLASCHRAFGDNPAALHNLEQALADSVIFQAPDLVASIYEQLSVAYAAIDDKQKSDSFRNQYLDLQEQTRQDRQLEARAGQLARTVTQLDWILAATTAAILLLVFLLFLFRYLNHRQVKENPIDELIEERREQLAVSHQHIEEGERRHLEQRAKISLVNSLMPLINRMAHEVRRIARGASEAPERLAYVRELIEQIEDDNKVLTQWIQLRQGQLSLHIESFKLGPLFDILAHSQKSFMMKGIKLNVEPTQAVVKADRILTLFMLNTLADNARKFTHHGEVDITAKETADYVEVSVKDTGEGMDEEQLAHVFEHQLTTHGFGLLNCKGIIEKYRKMSPLFSVCTLKAESKQGKGSRFYFRLPKGRVMGLIALIGLIGLMRPVRLMAQAKTPLARAAIYADSAYFSNINGTYERTLIFSDSCRQCLNEYYLNLHPESTVLLQREGDTSLTPPEILWLHDSVQINYNIILDIRNESAVAALALHEWQLYSYNNRIYTQLFKELSADDTLADYCRTMQQTKENRTIAVALLLLALLAIMPAWYFYYLRPRLNARFKAERISRDDLELLDDELRRAEMELANLHVSNAVLDNCLSALKHETMYYPSRISQLIGQGDMESASEVVDYYSELYNLLSQQAMPQVERVKLRLRPLEHGILGDATLIQYLYDILKRLSNQKQPDMTFLRRDDQYVEVTVRLHNNLDDKTTKIDRLLCRQIVRDHGEATNRRACSIREEQGTDITTIIIILPAYGKVQSNHR